MSPTPNKPTYPRLARVREALREKSQEILDTYMETIVDAKEAGESEVALKGLQWLMEHMPAEVDGTKLVDQSVDKVQKDSGRYTGPSIQIGFALGGVPPTKELTPPAIEAEVLTAPKEKLGGK